MKQFLLPFLLLTAVICITFFYARRSARTYSRIDLLQRSLSPVAQIVPVNDLIFFSGDLTDAGLYPQCQYVLAPHMLAAKDSTGNRWTLYVWDRKRSGQPAFDTLLHRLHWQQGDSLYHYYLTRKKTAS